MGRKKKKISANIFKIFFNSTKVYFLYLDQFVKYLMFPVFGQILGLILLFSTAYLFIVNVETLQAKIPFMFSEKNFIITYCCCLAPFFAIFIKAFYEYIIAFCALNSVCYIITPKKKVKEIDFNTHNHAVEKKLFKYIVLLFLFTVLSIILIIPIFWIFIPFFVLIFQIFALEQSSGPLSSIKRSIELIKGHYISTVIALLLCAVLTYFIIPELIVWAFNYFKISEYLTIPVEKFVSVIPMDNYFSLINNLSETFAIPYTMTPKDFAHSVVDSTIYSIFVMFTLPLRCCVFTNYYASLDIDAIKGNAEDSEKDEDD